MSVYRTNGPLVHVYYHYFPTSSLKRLDQSNQNFMWSLLGKRGQKIYKNCLGHMTNMATMPIYGKTSKNLLLQNQKSDDLKTWRAVSGTWGLQGLYEPGCEKTSLRGF